MVELTTYLYPAVQGLFCLVIAAVWLVGFLRQRNFGFLLLTLATLAEGYHQPYLSAAERSTTLGMIGMTVLGVYVLFWLAIALGAILVVFHRSKYQTPVQGVPPVSG